MALHDSVAGTPGGDIIYTGCSTSNNGTWTAVPNGTSGFFASGTSFEIGDPIPFETTALPPATCLTGHEIDAELIEYHDGKIIGYCGGCKQRMILPRVPGGLSYKKATAALARALTLEHADPEDDDIGQLLGDLVKLDLDAERESREVERLRKLIKVARHIVSKEARNVASILDD